MRIVVTGRHGQVARSLIGQASRSVQVVPVGRPQLDLAGEPQAIAKAIEVLAPDVIVSAAAYTAVDRAEAEPDTAFLVNEGGAAAVAAAAAKLAVPLIHLSTDYVFDGTKPEPYVETDPTFPTSVYGASKLAGEQAVLATHRDAVILRTAWIYSQSGANFVKTMLRLAEERGEVSVVADQLGNPTSADDIAQGVMRIASNLHASADPDLRGVFHMAAAGEASWADLAEEIFSVSVTVGGAAPSLRRITTAEYPTPAKRPANSRLDCAKLNGLHGVQLPHWRSSVGEVVDQVVRNSMQVRMSKQ